MQPFRKVSPQGLQRIYAEHAPTYHKTLFWTKPLRRQLMQFEHGRSSRKWAAAGIKNPLNWSKKRV